VPAFAPGTQATIMSMPISMEYRMPFRTPGYRCRSEVVVSIIAPFLPIQWAIGKSGAHATAAQTSHIFSTQTVVKSKKIMILDLKTLIFGRFSR
jgi:hypothetical protein